MDSTKGIKVTSESGLSNITANSAEKRTPLPRDMSPLRMRSMRRRNPLTSVPAPAAVREFKTFRERLCSSLPVEPVPVVQARTITTPAKTSSNAVAGAKIIHASPAPSQSTAQKIDSLEPDQVADDLNSMDLNDKPSNDKSEPKPKMLPDSRWAKEHLISTHTPPLSTKPNTNRNTPPQPRTQTSKQRRRGNRGPVRPKKENDDPHREYTMRVNMDMDEFQREVEELGLKTLKDSRWA